MFILISSKSTFCQDIDLFSNVSFLNFNFTKNNSDISENYDNAKNFSLLKYNLGCSFTSNKNLEYSLSLGYYRSKARREKFSAIGFDTLFYETWKQDISRNYNFYNLYFSLGKRILIKKLVLSTTFVVPLEINSKWISMYYSHTQDTILKTNEKYYEYNKAPTTYTTGLFFNLSVYNKVFDRFYAGFNFGTGLAINISNGKYHFYSKSTDLINNSESIRDEIYNYKEVAYFMPILSSIGIRYLLHTDK